MADEKEVITPEVVLETKTPIKEKVKKIKVKLIANVKYGDAVHVIGEKIYILASEVKEFETLKVIEQLVIEGE